MASLPGGINLLGFKILDAGIYHVKNPANQCLDSSGKLVSCNSADVTQLWIVDPANGIFQSYRTSFMKSKVALSICATQPYGITFPIISCDPMEDAGNCIQTPTDSKQPTNCYSGASPGNYNSSSFIPVIHPILGTWIVMKASTALSDLWCFDPTSMTVKLADITQTPYLSMPGITTAQYLAQNIYKSNPIGLTNVVYPVTQCPAPSGTILPKTGTLDPSFKPNCCNGFNIVLDPVKSGLALFATNGAVTVFSDGTTDAMTHLPFYYMVESVNSTNENSVNILGFQNYTIIAVGTSNNTNVYARFIHQTTFMPPNVVLQHQWSGNLTCDYLQLVEVYPQTVTPANLTSMTFNSIYYGDINTTISYAMNPQMCEQTWCPFSDDCAQNSHEMINYCAQMNAAGLPNVKADINCHSWCEKIEEAAGSNCSQAIDSFCTSYPNHPSCRCKNVEQTLSYNAMVGLFNVIAGCPSCAVIPPPPCWSAMCTLNQGDVDGPLLDLDALNPKCPNVTLTFCQQIIQAITSGNINISNNTFTQVCGPNTTKPTVAPATFTTVFNNGGVTCDTYCSTNWNGELTHLGWNGSTCQSATNFATGETVACNSTLPNPSNSTLLSCVCQLQSDQPFQPAPYPGLYATQNNGGALSCSDYCGRNAGNELPLDWIGATAFTSRVKSSSAVIDNAKVPGEPTWCLCAKSATATPGYVPTNPNIPSPTPTPVPTPPTPPPPPPPPSPNSPNIIDKFVNFLKNLLTTTSGKFIIYGSAVIIVLLILLVVYL